MILRKSVLRTLKERKFQYGGVMLLLMLAVMLYVSLSMAIAALDKRNETFIEDYRQESFHIVTSEEPSARLLTSWTDKYEATLEKRKFKDLQVSESSTLRLLTPTEKINKPYLSEGKMPNNAGEVAIAPVFAEANGISIGDELETEAGVLEVTGFVYLPDYIYMVKEQTDVLSHAEAFGIGVATEETINHFPGNARTEVLGMSVENPDRFMEAIRQEISVLQYVPADENARIQYVETEIEGAERMVTTLPLVILALSVFMVLLLMKRRIDMQRRELGTLMAMGYRRGELMKHYLTYAWVIGLSGTLLGVAAGSLLSLPLSDLYAVYFNLPAFETFTWNLSVLIIGLLVPVVLLLLSTATLIWRALQSDPLTLLRPKEMSRGKKSWLEKLPFVRNGSFLRRFRLRLIIRSKARALYVFAGVIFSSVLLLIGLITFQSMDRLVEQTYEEIQAYNYAVHYSGIKTADPEEEASPFTMTNLSVKGTDVTINGFGIDPETDHMRLQAGGENMNERLKKGAILSAPLAAVLKVKEGDTVTFHGEGGELRAKVTGIADMYIGNNVFLERTQMNEKLGLPENGYTGVWQDRKPETADDIYMVEDKQRLMDSFEATSGATRSSVLVMAAFAFFIGVLILTLLIHLIVEENSSSISLLKVMGYRDEEISKLLLRVYTPVVFLAYFVSIPLAGWSLEQTMNSLVEETGFLLPTDVNVWMGAIGLAAIGFTYWFSLFLSKRKLRKVSLQEALSKQAE